MQSQFFILKLLQNHSRGQRTFIIDPDEVYIDPVGVEFVILEKWFLDNVDNFIGQESGLPLSFLAGTWNMMSLDRNNSALGANDVGQEWIVDTFFWNR